MQWQPATRRQYRIATTLGIIALVAVGAVVATQPASGQAEIQTGDLTISDTDETINGDVSDVRLSTTLDYSHDVPDAERRLIMLSVAPVGGDSERIAFVQDTVNGDPASGTVTLDGSLFDHSEIDAKTVAPELASEQTTEIEVTAEIEVRRESGDPVTHTVTDTATLSLTDGTDLTAELGGSGGLTVTTA